MNIHEGKHFPRPTSETEEYWAGCRQHELRIQLCNDCRQHQFYPRIICSHCSSRDVKWVTASGDAELVSYSICHHPVSAAYKEDLPYVIALVQLAEGPTMMSRVVQCPLDEIAVGMALSVEFDDWSEEVSLPVFRPR